MKMCVSGGKERETELDMEKEAKEGQKVRGGGEEAGVRDRDTEKGPESRDAICTQYAICRLPALG